MASLQAKNPIWKTGDAGASREEILDQETLHQIKSRFDDYGPTEILDERARAKKKKHPPSGLGAHPVVKQLIAKKKGTKGSTNNPGTASGGELKIEELDEALLKKRLEALEKDLEEYKRKCHHYKNENEWYRNEIETTQKDTAEYIAYLQGKRSDKQSSIDKLVEMQKREIELYQERKAQKHEENRKKIEELKLLTMELEVKLNDKQMEITQLTDVMVKRSRHEAEIAKIKKEMEEADVKHAQSVSDLERSLLEVRIKLQREADIKIQEMENAAQAKAAKYLSDHTTALEAENRKLEKELRRCIKVTQEYIARKDALEKENRELVREQQVREDLLQLRIDRVVQAEQREKGQSARRRQAMAAERARVVSDGVARLPGLLEDVPVAEPGAGALGGSSLFQRGRRGLLHTAGTTVGGSRALEGIGVGAANGGNSRITSSRMPSRGHNAVEKQVTKVVVFAGSKGSEHVDVTREAPGAVETVFDWPASRSPRLMRESDRMCVFGDSCVQPADVVQICDECNCGSYQEQCVICGPQAYG
ncbi:hypothetical protein HK101_007465 [Irineochytrium annulatum]|nr:hypothetical protein HK101_007465 [Irineochytrium annulatum]